MTRRSAVEQTARDERLAAIDQCHRCDPSGWQLGPDHTPIDPAIRCTHNRRPPDRDITEPIHQPGER